MKLSCNVFCNFSSDIGLFPIDSTAKEAIQQAIAAVAIIGWPDEIPVAITAKRESPAPVTSKGFADSAGKG